VSLVSGRRIARHRLGCGRAKPHPTMVVRLI
jgi:hypothetical protein